MKWDWAPVKLKFPHPLSASFGGFCLFLLFLNAGFVIETPFFDLGKKTLFGQFSLEILDGLFYLVVMYDYFHFIPFSSDSITGRKWDILNLNNHAVIPGVLVVR